MVDARPTVSILLPVRNEGAAFRETLRSVLDQDYGEELIEVLVLDGRSDDETREVIASIAREDSRVRMIDNPGRIVPTGMNLGIRAARGEVVIRVDGHTWVAADYVTRCVEALHESGAQCAGGCMTPHGATFIGRLVEAATSGPFGVGNAHFHYATKPRWTETVYLGAWPRQFLLEIAGFDEEMIRNQDDELNYRLRARGGKVWLDPAIRSGYRPRGSLRGLWRQYFQYGFWKIRVFQKHPRMMRWRHFAPALFVVLGFAFFVAAVLHTPMRSIFAGLVALYAIAGWLAAAVTSVRVPGVWLMPVVYFVIHASYGAGFVAGLLRFFPLWFDRRRTRQTSILFSDKPGDSP